MGTKKKQMEEFMKVYAVVVGIVMGLGFIFLGIIRSRSIVLILGFISLLMGLLTISTLVKENDEYDICEIAPKNPKEPARSSA